MPAIVSSLPVLVFLAPGLCEAIGTSIHLCISMPSTAEEFEIELNWIIFSVLYLKNDPPVVPLGIQND